MRLSAARMRALFCSRCRPRFTTTSVNGKGVCVARGVCLAEGRCARVPKSMRSAGDGSGNGMPARSKSLVICPDI